MKNKEHEDLSSVRRSLEEYRRDPQKILAFVDSLRRSVIGIGAVILVFSIVGYLFAGSILRHFRDVTGVKVAAFGVPEAFFALLNVALAFGIFVSVPYVTYKVLEALPPLFESFSHRMMLGFWLASVFLFYAGAIFCIFVTLPYGIQFLLSYEGDHIEAIISVKKFVSFCFLFIFGFGLIFELPLAMILVGRIGIMDVHVLSRYRRYAVLVVAIIAAILTPTPDVFNMTLMGVPLYLLFEIGLLGMRIWRKRNKTEEG
jgi:sec-independent protein translocase protein TatC